MNVGTRTARARQSLIDNNNNNNNPTCEHLPFLLPPTLILSPSSLNFPKNAAPIT